MKLEELKDFIKFMEENNLCELEIEEEGKRIKLKKAAPQPLANSSAGPPQAQKAREEKIEGLIEIKSPMVGTLYRAAAPGAKPYIEIGDIVRPGDIVCIIEAMKLMNEIKAEVGGRIVDVLVDNGQTVEFGQALFRIEPA